MLLGPAEGPGHLLLSPSPRIFCLSEASTGPSLGLLSLRN